MRRFPQPDPGDVETEVVYCFGCGRRLGVSGEQKMAIYCEELCWHKEQLVDIEFAARNRAINYLITHLGCAVTTVADAFDRTRTRVNQVLAQSNDDYLTIGRREPVSAADRAKRSRAGKASAAGRWGTPQK